MKNWQVETIFDYKVHTQGLPTCGGHTTCYGEAVYCLIFASKEKSAEIVGPVILKGHREWKRQLRYSMIRLCLFHCASTILKVAQMASVLSVYIKF